MASTRRHRVTKRKITGIVFEPPKNRIKFDKNFQTVKTKEKIPKLRTISISPKLILQEGESNLVSKNGHFVSENDECCRNHPELPTIKINRIHVDAGGRRFNVDFSANHACGIYYVIMTIKRRIVVSDPFGLPHIVEIFFLRKNASPVSVRRSYFCRRNVMSTIRTRTTDLFGQRIFVEMMAIDCCGKSNITKSNEFAIF